METIPKDIVEKITNELSPQDFVKFCQNEYTICKYNDVFYRRIQKDFPFLMNYFDDLNINSKKRYLETFSKASKVAEKLIKEIIESYGNFAKQLNPEYERNAYSFIYDRFLIKNFILLLQENPNSEIELEELSIDIIADFYYEFKDDYLPTYWKVSHTLGDYLQFDEPWLSVFEDEIKKFNLDMFKYLNIFLLT